MKNVAFAILGAVVATLICSLLFMRDRAPVDPVETPRVQEPFPAFADLEAATSAEEVRAALEGLREKRGALGTISTATSRKVFSLIRMGSRHEEVCYLVGHLAALAGDTELLRKMVRAYFGSHESELKGSYVEEFLQYNPDLFFSLPDTWHLWSAAGGAEWCCEDPETTIPLVIVHGGMSKDAERILKDIENTVSDLADTEWGRDAARVLAVYAGEAE